MLIPLYSNLIHSSVHQFGSSNLNHTRNGLDTAGHPGMQSLFIHTRNGLDTAGHPGMQSLFMHTRNGLYTAGKPWFLSHIFTQHHRTHWSVAISINAKTCMNTTECPVL